MNDRHNYKQKAISQTDIRRGKEERPKSEQRDKKKQEKTQNKERDITHRQKQ